MSLKKDVELPPKSDKQKKLEKIIFIVILKVNGKRSRIRVRIRSQRYGSADPEPYQNVTDPEHCIKASYFSAKLERRYGLIFNAVLRIRDILIRRITDPERITDPCL